MNEGAGRRPLVLLVDDCGDVRDLYELLLASEFEVIAAARGADAIALAATRRPHVIVLDIGMPDIDGFAVCRELKRHWDTARIPVVMLTGGDYVSADAAVAGAFAVLRKPCPERRLFETIVAALAQAPSGGTAA